MDKQNITLSIRKDILQKAKILAIKRSTSLSAMLSNALEELVNQDEAYRVARSRHLRILREDSELGTYGELQWMREDLHDS